MKKIFSVVTLMIVLFACNKPGKPIPEPPTMHYTDFGNREIKFEQGYHFDLDGDGSFDFGFATMRLGDPILKRDRLQYYATSGYYSYMPIDNNEESKILNKGDRIGSVAPIGHTWYNAAFTVLAEKIIPVNGENYWAGPWTNIAHHYLAVQVERNGKFYFGWIELSFDKVSGKIILHKAAISKEEGVAVEAGV
jgi:hypothetical protein